MKIKTGQPAKSFSTEDMEGLKSMVPADFLIGPDLTVEVAYYGNDIGDHLPVEKINLWLDSSQPSEKPSF